MPTLEKLLIWIFLFLTVDEPDSRLQSWPKASNSPFTKAKGENKNRSNEREFQIAKADKPQKTRPYTDPTYCDKLKEYKPRDSWKLCLESFTNLAERVYRCASDADSLVNERGKRVAFTSTRQILRSQSRRFATPNGWLVRMYEKETKKIRHAKRGKVSATVHVRAFSGRGCYL